MDQPRTTLLALPDVPTLDPERTDQVGTFLTIEAAADGAAPVPVLTRPGGSPVGRRVVGGIAAALVLGGALFAANGIVGGPGPAAVPAAVAIEHADGWTTIEILDPQASPTEIEAALDAAGIDARVDVDQTLLTSTPPGSGPPLRVRASGSTSYSVATYGSVDPGELSGVKVEFPPDTVIALPTMVPALGAGQPTNEAEIEAWDVAYRASLEPIGIRISGPDDTIVSVRDGSAVTIVLSTPA